MTIKSPDIPACGGSALSSRRRPYVSTVGKNERASQLTLTERACAKSATRRPLSNGNRWSARDWQRLADIDDQIRSSSPMRNGADGPKSPVTQRILVPFQ